MNGIDDGDRWLRKKAVAALLGVSRHTLRRLLAADSSFPRFVQLTPGVSVVRLRDVKLWLKRKELQARESTPRARVAPTRAKLNKVNRADNLRRAGVVGDADALDDE
jgi:predicted DNA-binding transcriptional regulator AlpA